jgi:hypothetical protein
MIVKPFFSPGFGLALKIGKFALLMEMYLRASFKKSGRGTMPQSAISPKAAVYK